MFAKGGRRNRRAGRGRWGDLELCAVGSLVVSQRPMWSHKFERKGFRGIDVVRQSKSMGIPCPSDPCAPRVAVMESLWTRIRVQPTGTRWVGGEMSQGSVSVLGPREMEMQGVDEAHLKWKQQLRSRHGSWKRNGVSVGRGAIDNVQYIYGGMRLRDGRGEVSRNKV